MLTLRGLQYEQGLWALKNFGEQQPHQPLLGLQEELGELCHAHLKQEQGIRGNAVEHREKKVDAIGDIVIYLANYCTLEGIDFEYAVESTWSRVKQRDWKANPTNGA